MGNFGPGELPQVGVRSQPVHRMGKEARSTVCTRRVSADPLHTTLPGPQRDLTSTVRFDGREVPTEATMRVLGVQVDTRLRWREHVKQAAQKGSMAFEAFSRITASTWVPSMKRSRLLHTAVVRPAVLYGSQVWGLRKSASLTKPLIVWVVKKVRYMIEAAKVATIVYTDHSATVSIV